MRIYVPTTLDRLDALEQSGFAAPCQAHAVTAELREWYADGEADELEYAAADEAAQASLRLLAVEPGAPRRRVVVAADVPDAAVRPVGGRFRSSVTVAVDIGPELVASLHVDDDEAAEDLVRAAAAVAAADDGDDDAQFDVDGAAAHELLWYDASELADVLALGRQH